MCLHIKIWCCAFCFMQRSNSTNTCRDSHLENEVNLYKCIINLYQEVLIQR